VKTITVAPLGCYFSNENRAMGLRPHQHYATVTLTFRTLGELGFPVFEETVGAVHDVLGHLTARPFRDSTNEDVADRLFERLDALFEARAPEPGDEAAESAWEAARGILSKWGGEYELHALGLAVMGVPDDIGHSDGFATYTVERG
jgi:hypothetical protein